MQGQTFAGLRITRSVLEAFPQHMSERDNIKNNQKNE